MRRVLVAGLGLLFASVYARAAVSLTGAQQEWLRQHGKLVFAVDADYAPYTFLGDDGQARGLDTDVALAVGRLLGVEVEVQSARWSDALQIVQRGHADVLASMVQSEDRRDVWSFVEPHADVQYFLFVRDDTHTVHDLKDLEGMRVGVGKGSLVEPLLRANPKITVLNYDRGKGMEELRNREITAFAGNLVAQSHFIETRGISGIKVVGSPLMPALPYGMAVPHGHDELLGILNAALGELKTRGELAALQRKWFGDLLRPPVITWQALRWLRIGLGSAAGVALLGLLRSWELRRIVQRKTARISALRALGRSFGEARDVAGVLDRAMEVLDPLMKPDAVFVVVNDGESRLVRQARLPDAPRLELEATGTVQRAVCLPIVAEGAALGEFGVLSGRATRDSDFQQAVAAELGIALANASLFATLEDRVAERTRELNARTQQLEADLRMAREVQLALLPFQNVPMAEIARADGAEPVVLRLVGGDFFNVLQPSPTTAGVFICDVMGQGARAALLTAIMRTLLDELTDDARNAGKFLLRMNGRLMDVLKTQDTPIFVTAFYACFDLTAHTVTYSNAGHPWPLLLDRAGRKLESVGTGRKSGPALGLFRDAQFPELTRPLGAGQSWMLFTDGLFETCNKQGDLFGIERVQALIDRQLAQPTPQLLDALIHSLGEFCDNREIEDDICLVAIEATRATG